MLTKVEGGLYRSIESLGKQEVRMEFSNMGSEYDCHWYLSLIVFTKRKKIDQHFDNCEITGKSGAETFVIALKMLQEFEHDIVEEFPNCTHSIYITGADALRRKIYFHFLPRYGYKLVISYRKPFMVKRLN